MSVTAVERLAQSPFMRRLPAPLRDPFLLNNAVYFGGNFFAGLAGYAFQALLAAALGKTQFGEVASLIAIFYLIQILHFVAMATAARIAAPLSAAGRQSEVQRVYRDLAVYATVVGTAGMVVFILLTPLLHDQLAIGRGPLLILSVTVPLNLLVGLGRGVLQGEQRFLPLSLNFTTYGVTTLVFLPILLHYQLRAVGATMAIVLALTLCNLFASFSLRDLPRGTHHERLGLWHVVRGALSAGAGPGLITVFFNMDVILARHFLPNHVSGLYSAMSLLGKIIFFGTISISAVMFPKVAAMHAEGRSAHRVVNLSLLLVLAGGGVVALVYSLFPTQLIRLLLRNPDYLGIGHNLGIFALAMLGLAIANVLVYYFMGVHRRRFVIPMGIGAVMFFGGLALYHADLAQFTLVVTVSINAMALMLLALYLVEHPRGHQPGEPDEVPPPVFLGGEGGAA